MTDGQISRRSILYGSTKDDKWLNLEQCLMDHIIETQSRLNHLDDEIWGKIILMQQNQRIAKAYLRTATVTINGSDSGFDGKIMGYSSFSNDSDATYDDFREIYSKIGEGVAVKMTSQGHIIAQARGSSPVFVQDWRRVDRNCFSERITRLKGKLPPLTPTSKSDTDRAIRVFDMDRFKTLVSRIQRSGGHSGLLKDLLLQTCVRISLVKESAEPLKTPCWFILVNLVALELLASRIDTSPLGGQKLQHAASCSTLNLNSNAKLQFHDYLSSKEPANADVMRKFLEASMAREYEVSDFPSLTESKLEAKMIEKQRGKTNLNEKLKWSVGKSMDTLYDQIGEQRRAPFSQRILSPPNTAGWPLQTSDYESMKDSYGSWLYGDSKLGQTQRSADKTQTSEMRSETSSSSTDNPPAETQSSDSSDMPRASANSQLDVIKLMTKPFRIRVNDDSPTKSVKSHVSRVEVGPKAANEIRPIAPPRRRRSAAPRLSLHQLRFGAHNQQNSVNF